jgi:CysZ protein
VTVVDGMRYPWRGVELVAAHRELWPFVVGPAILLASLLLGAAAVAWVVGGFVLGLVWRPGPEATFWTQVAWVAAALGIRAILLGFAAVVLYVTSNLIGAPFVDRLSQEVEALALGPRDEPVSWRTAVGDLASSVGHSLLSFVLWLVVMAFCAALNVVPLVGAPLSLGLAATVTAFLLAREAMDGAMSRRRMSYVHKLRVVAAHAPAAFGFGLVHSIVLWIPFLNLAVLPMAVAGGTLMYCDLERAGLVPDAEGRPGFKRVG